MACGTKYCPVCSGPNGYHHTDCSRVVVLTRTEARRIVNLLTADNRPGSLTLAEKFMEAT